MVSMPVAACVHGGAERISDGVYVVNARGNAFVGQGEVIAEAYKQANGVCPEGFEISDSATGRSSVWVRTSQYTVQRLDKPEVTLVVRCTVPELAPPARRGVAPVSEAFQSAPWWCTYAPGYEVGDCNREAANCENLRSAISSAQHLELPACFPRDVAYCHRQQMPNGLVTQLCAPTDEMCRFGRDHAGDGVPLSECAATR